MTALELLRTQMQDAEPVLKALDVALDRIEFDPAKPASVVAAVMEVGKVIDAHLGNFKENPILGPMAEQLKSQYVEGIYEQIPAADDGAES